MINLERSNGERLSKIYYDKYRKGLGNEKFKKYIILGMPMKV